MKMCSCKGICRCIDCKCGAHANLFETLGNHNRMRILHALQQKPLTVSGVIEKTGLEQTCVSHCLRKLEEGRFVTVKREGKYRIYSVNKATVDPLLKLIDQHSEAQ
jgi:DNA-binding transcriptional ArsR family regulator